jgi:regulation of enolase protein 1 (concanavalin A-like superfamily)
VRTVVWDEGMWLNPPAAVSQSNGDLLVTCLEGSDFWRTTAYGFVHDSGHALLIDLPDGSAVETTFVLDYSGQFDQAGLLLRADDENWIKSGVEFFDGAPSLGGVVTRRESDWSTSPVPQWIGQTVAIRMSRSGDAVTVRARAHQGPWQLVRVAPIDPQLSWRAGIYCCAPTRSDLTVRFTSFSTGAADAVLHDA